MSVPFDNVISAPIQCTNCGRLRHKLIIELVVDPQFTCLCGAVYDFSDKDTQAGFKSLLEHASKLTFPAPLIG